MELTAEQLSGLTVEGRFDLYWRAYRKNPSSVAFIPLAHILLKKGMIDQALELCEEGLARHPELVSGRLIYARLLIEKAVLAKARSILQGIIAMMPTHGEARRLLGALPRREETVLAISSEGAVRPRAWRNLTMARILLRQGHFEEALRICEERLDREPHDAEAIRLKTEIQEKGLHEF